MLKFPRRRNRGRLLTLFIGVATCAVSLGVGLLLQYLLDKSKGITPIMRLRDVVFLSLSYGCCYGFIRLVHSQTALPGKRQELRMVYYDVTLGTLLFLSILFFVVGPAFVRLPILVGYVMGIVSLCLVIYLTTDRSKSARNLIIKKGMRQPETSISSAGRPRKNSEESVTVTSSR